MFLDRCRWLLCQPIRKGRLRPSGRDIYRGKFASAKPFRALQSLRFKRSMLIISLTNRVNDPPGGAPTPSIGGFFMPVC